MSIKAGSDLIFHKRIKVREQDQTTAEKIISDHKVTPIVARILSAREFEAGDELKDFLDPTLKSGLPDPKNLKNLNEAAELIASCVKAGESIAICSDFDVDGLSGASLVRAFFNDLGIKAENLVPDRFKEGYGLNDRMVNQAKDNGHGLLITIDYGTTNHKEIALAKELGLKVIVVDHHHVGEKELPPADVFVNPCQPGCNFADSSLCAAGLAWYLLIALRSSLANIIPAISKLDLREYLDLAALGTICDMVPLKGANRVIARKGLEALSKSKRPGIIALKKVSGVKAEVSSHHVGFGLGPRINSAGRMMNGKIVVELLTTSDQTRANKIANRLNSLNTDRRDVEKRMKRRAIESVKSLGELPSGIVTWAENNHTGIIGIIAQRLVETYYRPSVVMGRDGDFYKGSVRGIKGFSVVEALENLSEFFSKYGGHAGAGGFTLKADNPEEFATAFNKTCETLLKDVELVPAATADTEAAFAELDENICDEIRNLAPFGIGNPSPQLLIKNVKVRDVRVLKAAHLKVTLADQGQYLEGLMWNSVRHPALVPGGTVNLICKPEINKYQGNRSVQLNIQAVEKA